MSKSEENQSVEPALFMAYAEEPLPSIPNKKGKTAWACAA